MKILYSITILQRRKRLVTLALTENIAELLEWGADKLGLLPEIWGEVTVGVADSDEGGLEGVLDGLGGSGGGGVDILNTGELEKTLDSWGGDETGTAWSWDKSDGDGTALSGLLGWEGVWLSEVGAPVSATDWDDGELGDNDGGADGGGNLLGGLDAESDVSLRVTDQDDGLEAGTLSSAGLLLDWLDLYGKSWLVCLFWLRRNALFRVCCIRALLTFMTSSLSFGKKKSTIWYSLTERE